MRQADSQISTRVSNRIARSVYRLSVGIIVAMGLPQLSFAFGTAPEPELLEAASAFTVTARLVDDNALELRYMIAPGYFIYRDRFRFELNNEAYKPANFSWPAGKWKQDTTFGRVLVYRGSVRLLLPLTRSVFSGMLSHDRIMTLTAVSQGCADAGVCYPPLRQSLRLFPGTSAWVGPQPVGLKAFSKGDIPASDGGHPLTRGN